MPPLSAVGISGLQAGEDVNQQGGEARIHLKTQTSLTHKETSIAVNSAEPETILLGN